jgi:two-component system, response regulator PhcR
MTQASDLPVTAQLGPYAILLVDDEPQACKWFARLYGNEFSVLTAGSVDEALALLAERGREVAAVLTDYSMPDRNGVALLSELRSTYPHVGRLLASAYADKDVAMKAVNQGQVEHILEKPLDEQLTRQVLRDALARSRQRVNEQALLERRAATLRETLGFLAHEVTSPLATVRGYLSAMKERHQEDSEGASTGMAHIAQRKPGEVLTMIEAAQRRADYAQSLVSTFVQTARDARQGESEVTLQARDLVHAVRDEYPFEEGETNCLSCDTQQDFTLPGRRDLLYLVLCTLVKNALLAMRPAPPDPMRIDVMLTRASSAPGLAPVPAIRVSDNGPGIAPDVLPRLTHEPLTTRAESGGSGMGLVFCQRVMGALGGSVRVDSIWGQGASVTLFFPEFPSAHPSEEQP